MIRKVSILPLSAEHAPKVANLHMNYLRSNFKGRPGRKLLSLYYAIVALEPGAYGYVAELDGVVVGYACGVWDSRLLRMTLLRKKLVALMVWGVIQSLIKPMLLVDLVRRIVTVSTPVRGISGYELRPIVVMPQVRGSGVAAELVNALLRDASRRGFQSIWLETESDNLVAQAFYSKMGFIRVADSSDTPYIRYERRTN